MNLFNHVFHRGRKYPIQRDQDGLTIRQACFEEFKDGYRPAEVAREQGFKVKTVLRYFQDWKKEKPNINEIRELDRLARRKVDRDWLMESVIVAGEQLGLSVEESATEIQKPWGRKKFLAGKWPDMIATRERDQALADLTILMEMVFTGIIRDDAPEKITRDMKRKGFVFPYVDPETADKVPIFIGKYHDARNVMD